MIIVRELLDGVEYYKKLRVVYGVSFRWHMDKMCA